MPKSTEMSIQEEPCYPVVQSFVGSNSTLRTNSLVTLMLLITLLIWIPAGASLSLRQTSYRRPPRVLATLLRELEKARYDREG